MKTIAWAWVIALSWGAVLAQSPAAFEVASIRANRTATGRGSAEFLEGGERFTATNMSIGWLILLAYDVTPLQVSLDGPIFADRYDIQAKAERPVGRDQMRLMLQRLLAERFQLRIRREMRDAPVYALVVTKGGPKLNLSERQVPWSFLRAQGVERKSGRIGRLIFENESMPDFARRLTTLVVVGRVVVDQTGLKGNYAFELSYTPPDLSDSVTGPDAPSIFTAIQEQLGLELEPKRAPVEFLVVEHVERASEN